LIAVTRVTLPARSAAIDAIRDTQPLDSDAIARETGLSRDPFWPAAP